MCSYDPIRRGVGHAGSSVVAVLQVIRQLRPPGSGRSSNGFTDSDRRLIEAVLPPLAAALHNSSAFDRLLEVQRGLLTTVQQRSLQSSALQCGLLCKRAADAAAAVQLVLSHGRLVRYAKPRDGDEAPPIVVDAVYPLSAVLRRRAAVTANAADRQWSAQEFARAFSFLQVNPTERFRRKKPPDCS